MDMVQILAFHHLIRTGSFTKAAAVTFRSQSAVSQQIKRLEDELGCRLIERIGKHKIRLTPAGDSFFEFSTAILELKQNIISELDKFKGIHSGRLKLGAVFTSFYFLLPPVINKYTNQFPLVDLSILATSSSEILNLLKSGDIDFGIIMESVIPGDFRSLRWKKAETLLLAPKGHPLSNKKRVTLGQISKYPLILPSKDFKFTTRIRLEEKLKNLGLNYRIIMESPSVVLSSKYVELGLGISFVTFPNNEKDIMSLKGRELDIIPLSHLFESDYVAVAMRKNKLLTSYEKSFIDVLLKEKY